MAMGKTTLSELNIGDVSGDSARQQNFAYVDKVYPAVQTTKNDQCTLLLNKKVGEYSKMSTD